MAFVHLHNRLFSPCSTAQPVSGYGQFALLSLACPPWPLPTTGYMYGVPDLALACDAVNHNTLPDYKTWSHDKAFLERDRRDELEWSPIARKTRAEHAQWYVKDMAMWDEKGNIDELKPPLIIKPIFAGCEVYFTPDETLARDHKPELYHMIPFWQRIGRIPINLMRTVSGGRRAGLYYKPRDARQPASPCQRA